MTKKNWFKVKENRELILIYTTVILALFTGWMAWETHRMALQTKNSVDLMRKADSIGIENLNLAQKTALSSDTYSNKSIKISDSSLSLTRKSIINYEHFSKLSLRPYIVVDTTSFETQLSVGKKILITIYLRNVGKTPALNYYHVSKPILTISNEIFNAEKEGMKICYAKINEAKDEGDYIGADMKAPNHAEFPILSNTDYKDIFSGKKIFSMVSVVSYYDIFHDRHFMWYCIEYNPKKNDYNINTKLTGMK